MIPEWKTKKLTFLMIPDANRQVRRFRVPLIWLYFALSSVTGVVAALFVLASMQTGVLQENETLKSDRQAVQAEFDHAVAVRDEEITKLQEEVVRLSQEAQAFAAKMAELQTLERELLSLTSGEEAPTAETKKAELSSVSVLSTSAGVGGELVPVSTDETLDLSESTLSSFLTMTVEADRLEETFNEALVEAEKLAYLRSITPSIYPTVSTTVTSVFGYRRDPFTRKSAYHRGIDFGGNVGDPIFATAAGSVSRTGYDKAMGNHVFIKHGNGLESVYMHLTKSLVKKGQNVKKGEKIGTLGSTGRSTGPHLHYEVHKNGKAINPKPYIKDQEG
jgi:murein DD-endopeptidase MepM/ murein hydrolase activator NlpD